MKKYTLPEWAFLDGYSHEGDSLEKRTVILHTRSASVIEIIDRDNDNFTSSENALTYKFKYTSPVHVQRLMCVLHYSATLNVHSDKEFIKQSIMKPCAIWFCKYAAWEDGNILDDIFSEE